MAVISLLTVHPYQSVSLAVDAPKLDSPSAAVSAAEDLLGEGKYEAFADCFDADGQKQMVSLYVSELTGFLSDPSPATPESDSLSKQITALFVKHGVASCAKKGTESDEQLVDRLASQLRDPREFMVEATPIAFPHPKGKKPVKGEIKDIKLAGPKAQANYVVKSSPSDSTSQDGITFTETKGSWKIAHALLVVWPEG